MNRERVVIAMSGGVDSSVAAALLIDQGYEVIAISMRLYDADPNVNGKGCCTPSDLDDARRAAAILKIPYYAFDLRESFQKNVIDDFVTEYTNGRTPNPCVRCNQHIKFDALWDKAKKLGTTMIATGHYARIETAEDGHRRLLKGADPKKDQSYFLFPLNQEHLGRVLFPVGHMTKEQVRQFARDRGLPNADKPESQEICFVSGGSYADVIKARAAEKIKAGRIMDESGKDIGPHDGVHLFTIGQRRGLPAGPAKRYVASIDSTSGLVKLGTDETLQKKTFTCNPAHWTCGSAPVDSRRAKIMVRYRHVGAFGDVRQTADGAEITLEAPERAITPGQAAVFYDGDEVIGGGWIS